MIKSNPNNSSLIEVFEYAIAELPKSIKKEAIIKINSHRLFKGGIYFLIRNNKVVYIGQTNCFIKRIPAHITDKEFDSFFVYPIEKKDVLTDHEIINKLERRAIEIHAPEYNKDPATKNAKIPECPNNLTFGEPKYRTHLQENFWLPNSIEITFGNPCNNCELKIRCKSKKDRIRKKRIKRRIEDRRLRKEMSVIIETLYDEKEDIIKFTSEKKKIIQEKFNRLQEFNKKDRAILANMIERDER